MRTLCLHTILSTDNGFRVCLFNQWRDCYMNGWLNKYIWSLQGEEVALCKALSPNSNPSATVSHDILSVFNSVQSVLSSSLRPHGLQHARPPCPSSSLGVYSNSRPLSRWWHLSTSSSVVPFSSCLQSFPASGSFQLSQFFASGDQSFGVSGLASVLAMNIQDWSPLRWTGWISLQSKCLSRVFSSTTVQKHQFVSAQLSL